MLHITGGDWRGRKIRAPEGLDTRPTPSRVREALFSILGRAVLGAQFYDLYAGCGIVGLEALSRGAASCTFYESARAALTELRANVETLGCSGAVRIVVQRVPASLAAPAEDIPPSAEALAGLALLPADIFFLDPPYGQNLAAPAVDRLVELGWSARPGSICVVQVERAAELAERFGGWGLRRRYPYGDTALWVYDCEA